MTVSRSSGSASARNPTRPRLTPSSGTPASRASSAARRIVPSPPRTSTSSAPAAEPCSPPQMTTSVRLISAASAASSRTSTPAACRRLTTRRAASVVASRPVCASSRTDRVTPQPSHCAPSDGASLRTGLHRRKENGLLERRRAGLQPEEVLDVPARPRQRARCHPAHAQPELGGLPGNPPYRIGPMLRIAYDATCREPFPADFELRLDHGQQVSPGCAARDERRQHQTERDEGQVGDDQVDRPPDGIRRQV